jgi:uncharacterized SAM-binding protein YcdF (DUF218 family)
MSRHGKAWSWIGVLAVGAAIFSFTTWPRDVLQQPIMVDQPATAVDVVIVLGSGTRENDDNNLPPQAEQRVKKGVELVQAGYAPRLIVAGGLSPVTNLIEADLMATEAVADNLPAAQIYKEAESRDTWQNATNSLAIMDKQGWKTALVVTSPYHTWRACRMFWKQHANVRCVAAPYALVPARSTYEKFMDNRSVVREYGAIIYAWLQKRV